METWKDQRRGHEIVLNFQQELNEQNERTKEIEDDNRDLQSEILEYASDSSNESEKTFKSSESNFKKKISPVVHSAFSIDSILGKQDNKKSEVYLGKESFRKIENNFDDREDQDESRQFFNPLTISSPHSGN